MVTNKPIRHTARGVGRGVGGGEDVCVSVGLQDVSSQRAFALFPG